MLLKSPSVCKLHLQNEFCIYQVWTWRQSGTAADCGDPGGGLHKLTSQMLCGHFGLSKFQGYYKKKHTITNICQNNEKCIYLSS